MAPKLFIYQRIQPIVNRLNIAAISCTISVEHNYATLVQLRIRCEKQRCTTNKINVIVALSASMKPSCNSLVYTMSKYLTG